MARKINVTINPKTGEISYDLEGFSGTGCTDISELLARGDEQKDQSLKAEYFDKQVQPAWENQGND